MEVLLSEPERFFLLALNGSFPRFVHKTLKDEQKLVTYKKIVSGTKQVILVMASRFSNFLDNVKPYAFFYYHYYF